MKLGERILAYVAAGLVAILMCLGCAPRTLRLAERISHFDANYTPSEGDSMAGPLLELTGRLETWGITIGDLPPQAGNFGMASMSERTILLRPDLSINARFEVLAHEAGHLLQPPGLQDDAVGQVFAELVGVGVQQYYGSTTAEDVAARYLAQFKHAFGAERHLRQDIAYAVKVLTGQTPLPTWRHTHE